LEQGSNVPIYGYPEMIEPIEVGHTAAFDLSD